MPFSHVSVRSYQSVESWNQQLRDSMGACWRVLPPFGRNPEVFYQVISMNELSMLGVSVTSPIMYDSAPRARGADGRLFFIHMGDTPNRMNIAGQRLVQRPGECMLGDSELRTTSACDFPHSTVCAGIPAEMFRAYLPDAERFVGRHLEENSTYSRIVATLLSSLFRMATDGTDAVDFGGVTIGLLKTFSLWCALSAFDASCPRHDKVCYRQIKRLVNADIRDPALSVESIADKLGVSTRYLQLLFADQNDCVSHYIRRERLRGCLLDLRCPRHADQSITDIAFSWGFNSASHFSSLFRKQYGLTARQYRKCAPSEFSGVSNIGIAGALVLASQRPYS